MRRNVVLADLARRVASGLVLWLTLLAAPALAGDRAAFQPIGFSANGQFFAFEEYGVQDGSGFAYSSIYVIDLTADKWTYGTPFDARADEANADEPLADVRARALTHAQESLKPRHVDVPAQILALTGDGERGDAKTIGWSSPRCCGPADLSEESFTLALTTQPIGTDVDYCRDVTERVGYALTLTGPKGKTVLHQDGDKLPATRGCTLDYSLYAVLRPFEAEGPRVAVIATYPMGFEGPDRRFIVVPIDR